MSLEDEIIPTMPSSSRRDNPTRRLDQHSSGILVPSWWRWKVVLPVAVVALVSTAFSVSLLSGTKQRVAQQVSQAPTPVMETPKPQSRQAETPDQQRSPTYQLYEESLPQGIYEQAPVIAGISEIAKITEPGNSGTTRVVIPEENIPWTGTAEAPDGPSEIVSLPTSEPEQATISGDTLVSKPVSTPVVVPDLTVQPIPLPDKTHQPWQRYALPFSIPATAPMIAIVIDDMGVDRRRSLRATTLPGPLTLSYLTYARDIVEQTNRARAAGHELMLHVPMQPGSSTIDPGPNVLTTSNSAQETLRKLRWGMEKFDGYVGLNNHMGSAFTQNKEGMRVVLNEIKRTGLLFLDSRTAGGSVASEIARETGVTFASRNVFLDHVEDRDTVYQQLAHTIRLAHKNGSAIAIGHPRQLTLDILEEWLPTLAAQGIVLAPLSAIVIRTHQNALHARAE